MDNIITSYLSDIIKQYDADYRLLIKQSIVLSPEREEIFSTELGKQIYGTMPSILEYYSKGILVAKDEYKMILDDKTFIQNLSNTIENNHGIIFFDNIKLDHTTWLLFSKMLIEAKRELNNFNAMGLDEKHYHEKGKGKENYLKNLTEVQEKLKNPLLSSFAMDARYFFPPRPIEIIEDILCSCDELGINTEETSMLPILNFIFSIDVKKKPNKIKHTIELQRDYRKKYNISSLYISNIP